MSDHIPIEVQSEIIKRLPVKSVVQCRSVSKLWKSLIDSSEFIRNYHTGKTHTQHHILVKYMLAETEDSEFCFNDFEPIYISIVDDDTFPNQKSFLTVSESDKISLELTHTLYSVNGLLCFHLNRPGPRGNTTAFLRNPSLQKSVAVSLSNSMRPPTGFTFVGFGACPTTNDLKLVRIDSIGYPTVNNWEVKVFMLSTRVWKTLSNIPPAFKTCAFGSSHVCIDGFLYCLAFESIKEAAGIITSLIISFDLKSDQFGQVCLPDRLVRTDKLEVSKVYDTLGLFEYYDQGETKFCDVWIMKEGVSKFFTKMLSIKAPDSWVRFRVLVLRKNGEAIIQNIDDTNSSVVEIYDTSSGSISCMGIKGDQYDFLVNSYMESLLLLDELDGITIKDDDKV